MNNSAIGSPERQPRQDHSSATGGADKWAQLAKSYTLIPLNGKSPVEDKWTQWCEVKRQYSPAEFIDRNAGITTGPANGLLVLDIDDPDRFAFVAAQKGWDIPSTRTVETGSGTPHYYFEYPTDGRRYGNKSFGPKSKRFYGFDLRGIGGQVVAPGSIHPDTGKPYRVVKDEPVADCPQWILDLYEDRQPTKQTTPPAGGIFCGDVNALPIKAETKDKILRGVPVGGRSEAMQTVLNALVWSRLSDAEIYAIFEQYPIGEKYREKGESRQRWLAPQIEKARGYVTEFAKTRTFGTSGGRLNAGKNTSDNGILDVTDVCSNTKKNFLPAVPPFPIEVLHPHCQWMVHEHAEAYSVPAAIPGLAFLSTAGACIGRTRGLTIKRGWSEFANTFIAIVGNSGLGKSPPTRAIQSAIFKLEATWFKKYNDELKAYWMAVEENKQRRKKNGPAPTPPDKPIYRQLFVDDITTESLTDALAQNPRGVQWNRDELSGLILDLDKYSGKEGGTKARLLSAYDSGPWKVTRVNANRLNFISHACLSIFGTIQEKYLPDIFSATDAISGFLPRFNFIRVERNAPSLWTEATVSDSSRNLLENVYEKLLGYDFVNDQPVFIGVKNTAKSLFIDWFNIQAREPWADCESSTFEAVLAKLRGQCLRYALILHCIECVIEGRPEVEALTPATMNRAIIFADYLKEHQKSVWTLCFDSNKVQLLRPFEKRVAEAIIALEGEIKGECFQPKVLWIA